jgi:hypothetical protein
MSEPNPQPQGPVLSVPPELKPQYVNLVRIGHSPMELTLDFAHLLPGQEPTPLLARLVMSPMGAKLFLRALAENLSRYEAAFGEVHIPGDSNLASDLFRGVQPPGSA